jgi:FKBP-type peptidyl-prolyl cis-trans isomerase 2
MVEKGDKVSVHYTGTFESGEVFDSSLKRNEPLAFEVGSGQMISGFDQAVLGMSEGETKNITLSPDQAYGPRQEEMVLKFPIEQLPEDLREVEPGTQLALNTPQGQMPATVISLDEKEITLDANHQMAGKTLNFEIKVVDVNKA